MKPLLALVIFAAWAGAQTLPSGVVKKAAMAGITEYDYPNGLRVLLLQDTGRTTTTVNMTYLVGSRHEGYGETGMAHLLEHMNFIQTTNGRSIKKELTDHGANWNGTTDYDRTNYFETVPASEENLNWALGLEADRMVNMRMEKALLDTEMTVVRNEFEKDENSPAGILDERVRATAFLWHNYGKSTIGSRADIERVPIDRLAAFYRKYYQPDNAVLAISGPIDPGKTLAAIAATLGTIPKPARVLDPTYTAEPVQDGERTVELRRVGKGKNLMIAWHTPAMASPDSAALEVLGGILSGQGGTGRLYKALVDNKKAVSVSFGNDELHDPGLTLLSATLSDDQSLDDVKKIALETLAGIVKEAPAQEELDRAKTRIVQRMDREFASSQSLAMSMSEVAAAGDWRLLFTNYQEIKQVTVDDVVRVAKTYFRDSNRTVGTFIPDAAPDRVTVSDAPDMAALLRDYSPVIDVAEGEVLDPVPAAIEKRVVRSKLPGGFRLALLPKGTRGNTVSATITLRFGDEKSLAGRNAAAQMAEALLMRGTKTKNRQQLQDAMQKINATINVGGGGRGGGGGTLGSVTASITTTEGNLIPAMRLAVEILKEPAFPEADFEQIRKQQITSIERGKTDPATLSAEMIQANLSPFPRSDVRHVRTIDEQLEDLNKVTLADAKKFYQDFFGASQGEMVVVGRFDAAEVQKAAAELLGGWRSPVPYARIQSKFLKVSPINSKIETPDKENAEFRAGLRMQMSDTDPDYPAMVLANYIFGGSITSRMEDRIRNREGLSYGATSAFSAPTEGDAALFSATAISNPKNTPKVEASFLDELKKTLAEGFTAAEVAAAKVAVRDERTVGRSSDAALRTLLELREQYGRTLDWDQQIDLKLDSLTVDQVNAAFRRHVNERGISIVKAGDFKAAAVYQ